MLISRRTFLKQALVCGSASSLTVPALPASSSEPLLETVEISCPTLPPAFEGYRIGFLSDIHHGAWLDKDILSQSVARLNALDLDLLLLGGDYIWIHNAWIEWAFSGLKNPELAALPEIAQPAVIIEELAGFLGGLRSRDGIAAVLGNHDHWYAAQPCLRYLPAQGIELLINRNRRIRRGRDELNILGLDDYWTGKPRLPEGTPPRSETEFRLLLTHNPDLVSEILSQGSYDFDLALCGHTHGGQIRLPRLPAPCYNIYDRRFAAGLVSVGNSLVYTSRGLGMVELPLRLNCPAELTLLKLRRN